MKMADLFCGLGGATKGFQIEGWECIGYDLFPQPEYPSRFIQCDILEMTAGDLSEFDFIWSSSPWSGSKARKKIQAQNAEIPAALSQYIARSIYDLLS